MTNYQEFLHNKRYKSDSFGFEPNFYPDISFDYQKFIIEKAVKRGREAVFADTGLGKSLINLSIAKNIINETNKRVLILTPLAVAFQFIEEAHKIGIDDIEYSKDGNFTKKIVICNYERLHYFDAKDFVAVLADESSILKNFDGKTKKAVTNFMKQVRFRYLFTATPSPNDYIELGTSSEALGFLSYMDMLGRFFANNENNIRPQDIGNKWYLKPHARDDFFSWVNTWSTFIKYPSDLGFLNKGYELPKLIENKHFVESKDFANTGQLEMFQKQARSIGEVREDQKSTIPSRCEKAIEIAKDKETIVYWCNLNDEGDLLDNIDKEAVQLKGGMNIDKKEEILLNFAKGDIKRLIVKPKIASFGLNWQHCNNTIFFPTWSYEQYYQSIRRFWRFGQKKDVTVDIVLSEAQKRVLDTLLIKTEKAKELYQNITNAVNKKVEFSKKEFTNNIIKPLFL